MEYEKGTAIFLPLKHSLWKLRQATKQALLNHHSPQPFKVLHEELYYPEIVDRHLEIPEVLFDTLLPFEEMISDEENGIWGCLSLVEMGTGRGLLLHRSNGLLFAACLPFPSQEEAQKEHELMQDLLQLAEKTETTKIYLDRYLHPGQYPLKELLQFIAKSMK